MIPETRAVKARQNHVSVQTKIVALFIGLPLLWLVATSPFVWRLMPHPWWFISLRALYFFAAGAILYFTLHRELVLARSREDYNQLFNTLLEPVVIHQNGVIVKANSHALHSLEVDDEQDLIGRSILTIVHADYRQLVVNRIKSLEDGNPTQRVDEKFVTVKGNVRDVEITGVPITFQGGSAIMILFRDITERIHEQTALQDSQNRLRTLIDSMPEQICLVDNEGRWVEANQTLLQSLGLERYPYRGKTALELADACHLDAQPYVRRNSKYTPETFESVTSFNHEDYEDGYLLSAHEVTRVPVRDEQGTARGLVVVARDVTEQRLATKRILESEQRYRSLFDNDGDMIVSVDVEGMILSANPSSETTLGYSPQELIGHRYREFVSPQYIENSYHHFIQVLEGQPQRATLTLLHKDGHDVPVSEKKVPIIVENRVTGFFCIVRDISEQRAAEELLIKSERLSAVGQMAAGIVHEIRNPLTVLKGFVQLMKSNPASKEFYLSVMNEEFERIESILTELLVFAKPTVRKLEKASCEDIISDVVHLMRSELILKDVMLTTYPAERTLQIYCDKNGIKQVLVNVIKNGIEAMPHGGRMEVRVSPLKEAVSIVVRDEGLGIPMRELDRVGEPFFTTKENGTGLGLMVCRKIVEAHQGTFRIDSQVGLGTVVEIVLPFETTVGTAEGQ